MTHFHELKVSAKSQCTVEVLGFNACRAAARGLAQGRTPEDLAADIGWTNPKVVLAAAEAANEYCKATGWPL